MQTGYALYAPENLRSEASSMGAWGRVRFRSEGACAWAGSQEPVPALVPSAAVRWSRPAPEAGIETGRRDKRSRD